MTCEGVVAVLDELTSDAAVRPEYDEVVEHISHCQRCTQTFHEYMTIVKMAGTLAQTPPPPGVQQRLHDFVAAALRRKAEGGPSVVGEVPPPGAATE